jgi:hypothetical protein
MKFSNEVIERIRKQAHEDGGAGIQDILEYLTAEDLVRALEGVVEGAVWADVAKAWERVGMVRAAEICEGNIDTGLGPATCAAAIRAEAAK